MSENMSFWNFLINYWNQLLNTATKVGLNTQKVIHVAVKITDGFIGNKIADKIMKPDMNLNAEK